METKLECITPAKAQKYLEKNPRNRMLKPAHLSTLEAEMRRGWRVNGESIKFTSDNVLLDGQHRLTACVNTGVTFSTLVVRGLSFQDQDTIDTGRRRQGGDVLAIHGYKNSNLLAAAVRWVMQLDGRRNLNRSFIMPNGDLLAVVEKNPDIERSVLIAMKANKLLVGSAGAALHFLASKTDAEKADVFFGLLATGENLIKGNPVLTLREFLLTHKATPTGRKYKIEEVVSRTIRAWNAFKRGDQLSILKGAIQSADGKLLFPEIE